MMFCIGFNTKPRFRVSLDFGPRGHQTLVTRCGLPLEIAAEFYISSTGAQITLGLGPVSVTPYLFWPDIPHYYSGIGYNAQLGPNYHHGSRHWWPKYAPK